MPVCYQWGVETNDNNASAFGARTSIRPGASFGVGSLPHRSLADAVSFAWRSTDIVTIPSLPRRSPAEGMIAQALVGITGVSVGQYGGITVDAASLDPKGEVTTDLNSEAYAGFSAFLRTYSEHSNDPSHIKWQFVGPITLGLAMARAGIKPVDAIRLAQRAVKAHVRHIEAEVARVCGPVTQIVVLDEPMLHEALLIGSAKGFSADDVLDLVSGALAGLRTGNISGVHNCGQVDWSAMLATGANVLSIPVPSPNDEEAMSDLLANAARVSDFLDHGGRIAWGAVRTDGPISVSADRPWRMLAEVMCALVQSGVDPLLIRRQSFVTSACGLGTHSESVANRVMSQVREISAKVAEQATASRLTLGS
jgi:hypothetical protein